MNNCNVTGFINQKQKNRSLNGQMFTSVDGVLLSRKLTLLTPVTSLIMSKILKKIIKLD